MYICNFDRQIISMFFRDIPGKKEEKSLLIQQVKLGQIPHAQLFLEKEGYGGLPLVLAYVSFLMCKNRQESDSCGECEACTKSMKWIHPDIHFAYPVVKYKDQKREDTTSKEFLPLWRSKLSENPYFSLTDWVRSMEGENSAPNINVRECNEIIHKLSLMSFEGSYKVLIMWLPEFLGKEGNRLLKLIEEPPKDTVILLITQQAELILPTVISRCQIIRVHPFDHQEIAEVLSAKYNIAADKATQIAHMADGNMTMSIEIGNQSTSDFSDMLISWLRISYKGDPVELQDFYAGYGKLSKEEMSGFIEYGLHFFRQFIRWSVSGSKKSNLTRKEEDIIEKMSAVIDISKAEAISWLLDRQLEYIYRNANTKIMFLADSLTVGDIMKGKENVTLHSYYK